MRLFSGGLGKAFAKKIIFQSKWSVAMFKGGHAGLLQFGKGGFLTVDLLTNGLASESQPKYTGKTGKKKK